MTNDNALLGDLNETIASAVNARIEATVAAALMSEGMMAQYVSAALNQQVTVKNGYREEKTTYLHSMVTLAIQGATKTAVERVLVEEAPLIEEEVRRAIKRHAGDVASKLVSALTAAADKPYGVSVELKMPRSD